MAIPFPDIDPVALSLGPLQIRWYALAYLTGILLGWKYALSIVENKGFGIQNNRPNRDDIDNFVPFTVLGVILGGRLGYVLFYQSSLYMTDPLAVLRVWEGGMSFHGGALGVMIAMILFAWRQKIQLLRLSDIVSAVVPIGLFFGRIANFINGELFGRSTDVSWAMMFPYGGNILRHPSQLYEAALEGAAIFLILLFLLWKMKSLRYPGVITGAFLMLYGSFRMLVEQFREPDAHIGFLFGQVSMGQVLSIPMVLFGAGIILYAFLKARRARRL